MSLLTDEITEPQMSTTGPQATSRQVDKFMTEHGSEPAVSQALDFCGLAALQPPGHCNMAVIDVYTASVVVFICTAEDMNVRRETRKHAHMQIHPVWICCCVCVSVHI